MDAPIDVAVERSGIADILSVSNRADAERLQGYLKVQGCTVGAIFESGEFSLFGYSLRHSVRETVSRQGGYRLTERLGDVE
ncbi:MAG TPA: hypothetical protein VG099_10300 [Gemmataceae bacterium]|jgi:hypothetical protein|nr:hypothetical protein [Gemmataceae bacterium]